MPLKITYIDKRNLKQDYLKHLAASSKSTTEDDPFQKSFDEIYTKLRSALSELILVQSASHKSSLQNFRIDGDNYEILKSFITSSLNNLTSNPHNQQSVDAFLTKIKESLEPYYDILNGEAGASSLAEKIANLIIIEAREFILTEIARDHALLLSREQAPLSPSQAEAEASALVTPTQRISLARKPQGQNTRFLPEIPSATSMARSPATAFMPAALEPSFGAKAQRAQTSSTLAEVQRPPRFLEPLKKRPDTPHASLATSMARSPATASMPEALEPSFGAKAQRGFSEESDEQDIGNPAPKHQQQIPINESQEIKELKAALQKEIKEKRALKSSSEATILRLTQENTELLNALRGTRTAYKELQESYRTDFGKFEENVARTRAELDLSDGEAEREATTRLEEEPQAAAREQEEVVAAREQELAEAREQAAARERDAALAEARERELEEAREQDEALAAATRLKEEAEAREEEYFAKRKELIREICEKLAENKGTIKAIFGNLLNFDENIDQSFLGNLGINGDYNINQIQVFAQQIQEHLDSKQSQSGSASARMKTSIAPDIYDEIVEMSKNRLLSLKEAPDDLEGLTQVLHEAQEMETRIMQLLSASNSKIEEAEGRREEAAARERAATRLKEEAEAREQEDFAKRKELVGRIQEKLATNTGTIQAIFGNLLNFDENIDQSFLVDLGINGDYNINQIQFFAQKIQEHLDSKQSQSGSASARMKTSIAPDIYDEIVAMSKDPLLSLEEAPDDLEGLTQVLHKAQEMEIRLTRLYTASNSKIREAEGRREEAAATRLKEEAEARRAAAATRLKEEEADAREEEYFAKRKQLVGRIQEKLATNTGTIQAIFGNLLNFDENIDQGFLGNLGINGDYNINQIQVFAQRIQEHLDSKQPQSGSASARIKTSIAPDIFDEIVKMSKDPLLSSETLPRDLEDLTQVFHKAQEMEIRLTRLYTASNSKIREAEGRREEALLQELGSLVDSFGRPPSSTPSSPSLTRRTSLSHDEQLPPQ